MQEGALLSVIDGAEHRNGLAIPSASLQPIEKAEGRVDLCVTACLPQTANAWRLGKKKEFPLDRLSMEKIFLHLFW